MSADDPFVRFRHMLDAARKARQFVKGVKRRRRFPRMSVSALRRSPGKILLERAIDSFTATSTSIWTSSGRSSPATCRRLSPRWSSSFRIMNKQEAKRILDDEKHQLRMRPFSELSRLVSAPKTVEIRGDSGVLYQLETEAVWDDKTEGHLRVIVSIDDGGWRALSPMTDSFIVAPDGSFIGE